MSCRIAIVCDSLRLIAAFMNCDRCVIRITNLHDNISIAITIFNLFFCHTKHAYTRAHVFMCMCHASTCAYACVIVTRCAHESECVRKTRCWFCMTIQFSIDKKKRESFDSLSLWRLIFLSEHGIPFLGGDTRLDELTLISGQGRECVLEQLTRVPSIECLEECLDIDADNYLGQLASQLTGFANQSFRLADYLGGFDVVVSITEEVRCTIHKAIRITQTIPNAITIFGIFFCHTKLWKILGVVGFV